MIPAARYVSISRPLWSKVEPRKNTSKTLAFQRVSGRVVSDGLYFHHLRAPRRDEYEPTGSTLCGVARETKRLKIAPFEDRPTVADWDYVIDALRNHSLSVTCAP
jgi:hypothetical protein